MATRKKQIPVSRWWVVLSKPKVRDWCADHSLEEMGVELGKKVGAPAWSHSAISRFIGKGEASADLAAAISAFFKLPRPAFYARSAKEAFEMEAVVSKYDSEAPMSEIDAEILDLQEKLEQRLREREAAAQHKADKAEPKKTRARR
jgi:hypothetical protein